MSGARDSGRRRWQVVVAAAVLSLGSVAGVAGCGGSTGSGGPSNATSTPVTTSTSGSGGSGPSPSSPGSPSVSTAPVSSPASSAPVAGNPALGIKGLPEAAKAKTTDGAIAFVKFYVDVLNETGYRPRVGLLEPMAGTACSSCANFQNSVKGRVERGWHTDGPLYKAPGQYEIAADLLGQNPPAVHVRAIHTSPTVHERTSSGAIAQTYDATTTRDVYLLAWQTGQWKIQEIEYEKT